MHAQRTSHNLNSIAENSTKMEPVPLAVFFWIWKIILFYYSFSVASSISWWCWTTSSWFNSKQCPRCWKNWIFLWQVLCASGWVESFSRQSSKFWEYMYKLWRYCNYGSLLYLLVFMSSLVSEAVPLDRVDLLPYGQFCNLFFIPWSVQKDRILVNRRFAALDILRSFRSLGYC